MSTEVRVGLPAHLRGLAQVSSQVHVAVDGEVTQRSVLDALEVAYPVLRGTIRDRVTGRRRDFVRFFAGEEDRSHDDPDTVLPDRVLDGSEPFLVIGAMAGG